jgi:starch-binding outer membrane protein, SusD/RagB family
MNDLHESAFSSRWSRLKRRASPGVLLLAGTVGLSACELSVLNPSQIADEALETPTAIPGIVFGALGDYSRGRGSGGGGGTLVSGAMLTDEMSDSGSWVGIFGLNWGQNRDDWAESHLRWAEPAQARWTLNRAIERVSAVTPRDPAADPNIALLNLYGGFASRVLGDNFCDAVRDGGPPEPFHVYHVEAEQKFTQAIAVAQAAMAAGDTFSVRNFVQERMDNLIPAAYAGRAQARAMLASLGVPGYTWQMVLDDAAQVPTELVHFTTFTSNSPNPWPTWSFSLTSTEATVWGTWFREVGQNFALPVAQRTGDARVVYETLVLAGEPRKGRGNRREFIRQRKYTSTAANIPNVEGTEMRLYEGEAALHAGNWQGAIDKINEVRQFRNAFFTVANQLPMVSASNATEAWEALMRERGIEFWLQGRRLQDLRRWEVNPGKDMVPFQVVRRPGPVAADPTQDPWVSVYEVEAMCIAVSQTEKLANPNWR